MKTPRRLGTIVVDLGYDELNISDDTLLVSKYWSSHFARVVAPCSKEARGNVSNFSSCDFSDVSELTKVNLVANCWYVKKHFANVFVLDAMFYHMPHFYS